MSTPAFQTAFVRPARQGLRVVDPETHQPLPADGAEVPLNSYWRRKLKAGEVKEVRAQEGRAKSRPVALGEDAS